MTSRAGAMLRHARREAGLSQRQLAARSGVLSTLLSAYENGHRQPAADTFLALLDACGVGITTTDSVTRSRRAAAELEQVCALAMALPRRDPGPLTFPSLRSLAG